MVPAPVPANVEVNIAGVAALQYVWFVPIVPAVTAFTVIVTAVVQTE